MLHLVAIGSINLQYSEFRLLSRLTFLLFGYEIMVPNKTHLVLIKRQNNLDLSSASTHRLYVVVPDTVSYTHIVICF
jgi:hypothetical protein